jgi:multiple sugar transport system substrate-binding protein
VVAQPDGDGLEDGELVIMSGLDQSAAQQQHRLVEQWGAIHPKNPVRIVSLSASADAAYSDMLRQAQQGGDGVDIYNLDVIWVAEFAESGYIRELDRGEVSTDGFLEEPLKTCEYDGKLWALPFNTDAGLLYHRTDEPPSTWEDIQRETARTRGSTQPRRPRAPRRFSTNESCSCAKGKRR